MYGQGAAGLHLFWLSAEGFEKALYLPADAFREPVVRAREQKLEVTVSVAGAVQRHEMLWWGP
jgi:hypothetical protein